MYNIRACFYNNNTSSKMLDNNKNLRKKYNYCYGGQTGHSFKIRFMEHMRSFGN